ncbi:MAG: HEAT repeat domain-containing protein [Polyangiaceae bacterium]
MMRRKLGCFVVCALIAGTALSARDAASKPPANAGGKKKPAAEVTVQLPPGTLEKLHSGDETAIKAALDDVRMAGKGAQAAAAPIADLLEHGMTNELTVAAIDTLGDVEAESSSKAIAWYAVHRNSAVRQAAVKALARTKGPVAVGALRHSLSDGDAVVRGLAATGLGSLKARDAVRDLFVALDHHVAEAAASIGQLCLPAECDELAGKLGKLPFDIVTGGLDQVLFRAPTEIDDDQKVKLIGRLRELGTAEGNKFLKDVQKRWPQGWSQRVKQAIDQGVLATSGVSP